MDSQYECLCCNDSKQCLGIATREQGEKGCDCESYDDCPTLGCCAVCSVFEADFSDTLPSLKDKKETVERFAGLILGDLSKNYEN